MSDLRKRTQHLPSLEGAITAVHERATVQQNSVSQRLKWAAGANPTLHNVLHEFEKAVRDRATTYAVRSCQEIVDKNKVAFISHCQGAGLP